MSFVPVPAEAIISFLETKGFARYKNKFGNEIVYFRRSSRNPNLLVKVYTSVREGSTVARAKGTDAIRVVVAYEAPSFSYGVAKLTIVKRTGTVAGVLNRISERLDEAYKVANNWLAENENV